MVIKKENAAADMRDLTTAGTNGGKSTCQEDNTTLVALMEDHLETVKELERYKTKLELLQAYLKYHYVDDPMVRVIAGDLE